MKEKSFERFAMFVALAGVLLIIFMSDSSENVVVAIGLIDNQMEGNKVMVNGIVETVQAMDEVVILNLKDSSGSIKAVAFTDDLIEINENDKVEIVGEVVDYKGQLEIEAELIRQSD